ncbi:MAG: hypothetical protein AB7F89_06595 [Pirellulaceae bacterium]
MKNILTLTLVALAAMSQSGCALGWPRWLCRGDQCGGCSSSTGYVDGAYSTPSLVAPSYIAPPELQPQPLPGPAAQTP